MSAFLNKVAVPFKFTLYNSEVMMFSKLISSFLFFNISGYVLFWDFAPSAFEIIGPVGKSFLASKSAALFFGNIFTKIVSLSFIQLNGLPILAFTVASVNLVALAEATSITQSSTPVAVVWENEIFLSFGDQAIVLMRGFVGKPVTCTSFKSFILRNFRLFTYVTVLEIFVVGLIRNPPNRNSSWFKSSNDL